MRRLVLFMHTSLDGFVAGPNGEMDWITVDDEIFDFVGNRTDEADTALYGRVTYQMMEGYWPTAGDQPNASRHDVHHSKWYKQVEKIVLSKTLLDDKQAKRKVIGNDLTTEISKLKQTSGKDIIIFGSPRAAHALMAHDLIDEFWLFQNPMLLGEGIPVFKNINSRIKLKLKSSKPFKSGVICLHYTI